MAVTRPGEVEWTPDGGSPILIGVTGQEDVWVPSDCRRRDWHPHWLHNDPDTVTGGATSLARPAKLYPSLISVMCADAEAVVDLIEAMLPDVEGTLEWWDDATGTVYTVSARGRRAEPDFVPPDVRTVALEWFIGDPSAITADGS